MPSAWTRSFLSVCLPINRDGSSLSRSASCTGTKRSSSWSASATWTPASSAWSSHGSRFPRVSGACALPPALAERLLAQFLHVPRKSQQEVSKWWRIRLHSPPVAERLFNRRNPRVMARVLLLNGPNLNLLGSREPAVYGTDTLESLEKRAAAVARETGHDLVSFQSNAEHELIERIHKARAEGVAFLIVNPGAFTHTSIALRDAILATGLPFIEVHLSNPHAREAFRRQSYFSDIAIGVISGLGVLGYEAAVRAAAQRLAHTP